MTGTSDMNASPQSSVGAVGPKRERGTAPRTSERGPQARSLLIAGAQKSASTSVAELVRRHPRVSMARREVAVLDDRRYPEGVDQLCAEIEMLTARGLVPALKRPEMLYHERGAERARRHLPDPLVVVVLREPVARTVSAYHHYVRHGLLPAVHPNAGLSTILDESDDAGRSSVRSQILTYSLYSRPLARLHGEFGDHLLVFFQEELLSDPAGCAARILDLLSLERVDLGALPRANAGDYSLRRVTFSRLGGRVGYEVNEEDGTFRITSRPLRRLLGRALFALDRLAPRTTQPPELSPEVRARLVAVLAEDARLLESVVGRPPPHAWIASLGL